MSGHQAGTFFSLSCSKVSLVLEYTVRSSALARGKRPETFITFICWTPGPPKNAMNCALSHLRHGVPTPRAWRRQRRRLSQPRQRVRCQWIPWPGPVQFPRPAAPCACVVQISWSETRCRKDPLFNLRGVRKRNLHLTHGNASTRSV